MAPSVWALTPVGRGGEILAFLAIMHAPGPEPPVGAAVEAASRRWKLTTRQAEIVDKAGVCNRATLIMRALEMGRR